MREYNKEDFEALRCFVRLLSDADGDTMVSRMRAALFSELSPRQLQVIELYYLRGMDQTRIARLLGVTQGTVSRTVKRAREKLRRTLRYGGRALLDAVEE